MHSPSLSTGLIRFANRISRLILHTNLNPHHILPHTKAMMAQNDDSLGLALTSEDVDDMLNFGKIFNDMNSGTENSALLILNNRDVGRWMQMFWGLEMKKSGCWGCAVPSPMAILMQIV